MQSYTTSSTTGDPVWYSGPLIDNKTNLPYAMDFQKTYPPSIKINMPIGKIGPNPYSNIYVGTTTASPNQYIGGFTQQTWTTTTSATSYGPQDIADLFGKGFNTFLSDLHELIGKKCLVLVNHLEKTRRIVPKIYSIKFAYNQWFKNWPFFSGLSGTANVAPSKPNPFLDLTDSEYDVLYVDATTEEEINESFGKLQDSDVKALHS